jgi:hypothetical protein
LKLQLLFFLPHYGLLCGSITSLPVPINNLSISEMKQTLSIALLALALIVPNISEAQKKLPLPDVEIQLLDASGRPVQRQTTAQDGSWSFVNLPPGEYSLDIAQKEIEQAALLVPAVQKVREAASRSKGGVNVAAGDVNGDGATMEQISLNFTKIEYGYYEPKRKGTASREAGSGQASGKRTHKPVTFVKEWNAPSSPVIVITEAGGSLGGDLKATYDLKAAKK